MHDDEMLISEARAFATEAHAGQFRKDERTPYIEHPVSVARTLERHGCTPNAIAAGLLHDTIEDHYVLHRMAKPALPEAPARAPKRFRLSAHLREEQRFSYPMRPGKLRLRVLFQHEAALHLMERRLSVDHRATERDDGRVLIEATVPDTADLRWWLLGFGSAVEVLEPQSLREEFRDQAREMSATYG